MRSFTIIFAIFCLSAHVFAGGKEGPKMSLTFHLESNPDPGKRLTFKANTSKGLKHFRKIPEVGTSHIASFAPFASPHNNAEFGLIIKLNREGATKLSTFSSANLDAHLLVFLNGRPVDLLKVDGPVKDGILCVWKGVTSDDIRLADTLIPRIGQTEKEWKAKRKALKKK